MTSPHRPRPAPTPSPFRTIRRARQAARARTIAIVAGAVLLTAATGWGLPLAFPSAVAATVEAQPAAVPDSSAPQQLGAVTPGAVPPGAVPPGAPSEASPTEASAGAASEPSPASLPAPSSQPTADPAPPPAPPADPGPRHERIDIDTTGYQPELDRCLWVRMDLGAIAPIVGAHNYCGGDVILSLEPGDRVTLTGTGLDGTYRVTGERDAHAGDNAAAATEGLVASVLLQTCYYDSDAMRLVTLLPEPVPTPAA